jgi:hypothetical protein
MLQLVKNGTGGAGMETSRFRFVGCLEVQSCLVGESKWQKMIFEKIKILLLRA